MDGGEQRGRRLSFLDSGATEEEEEEEEELSASRPIPKLDGHPFSE
jgi:hypothetical protein